MVMQIKLIVVVVVKNGKFLSLFLFKMGFEMMIGLNS